MKLSIVIPAFDEQESIPSLYKNIYDSLEGKNISYEIILIDDGSSDNTWEEILKISKKVKNIIAIKFKKNYGKSRQG